MTMTRTTVSIIVPMVCLLFFPCAVMAKSIPPLAGPPLGELWYIISMGDERTGFAHTTISAAPGGYEIVSAGSVKMLVLGFSREASSKETYMVNKDLSLRSFAVEQTIDGSPMRLRGEVTARGVIVHVESAGGTREKTVKVRGAVYPPPVLNLYPLMRGITPGKKYRLQMLDVEEVKVKDVTVSVIDGETLPGWGDVVHLRNDLYPFVDNDIWIDPAGNTVKESVRDGLIVTNREEGSVVRQFILEAALAKKDFALDFSLVRVVRTIEKPLELKKMVLELSGFPEAVPLLVDGRQKAVRLEGGRVIFTVDNSLDAPFVESAAMDSPENKKYLEPTDHIMSDTSDVIEEKGRILKAEKDPLKAVQILTRWVAANIEDRVIDSQTALETLRSRKGNCQSHTRLYAALARSAGIPTRFVSGLVYRAGKGFLYHSWAESYAGRWIAVDPTFGQIPADATHVKLVEGDSPGELAALAGIVGRVKGKIMEEKY